MISHTKKWILAFSMTTALTLPTISWAEIPFNEARGMLLGTKPELRQYSPFWAMVALHGKMLENIRFFGNYTSTEGEERDEDGNIVRKSIDTGKDNVAKLIQRLFNSPDGVQFVPTTYETDTVGNLSRNLEAINGIIEVLISNENKSIKLEKIQNILKFPLSEKDIEKISNKELENVSFKNHKDQIETELKNREPERKIDNELKIIINDEKNKLKEFGYSELIKLCQNYGITVPDKIGKANAEKQENSATILRNMLLQASKPVQNRINEINRKIIIEYANKEFHLYDESQFDGKTIDEMISFVATQNSKLENNELISLLSPESKLSIAEEKMSINDKNFAMLLLAAYDEQPIYANPTNNPNQYLYPENIVITALLTFFVKIADSADDLKKLPFIMNTDFVKDLSFTKEQYENVKNTPNALDGIILNQNEHSEQGIHNIEDTFLMEEGFENWDASFPTPVTYTETTYKESTFPDCGETSLRNVLSLIFAAYNGSMISQDAITHLKNTIQVNDPSLLGQNTPFSKMLSFFNKNKNLSMASHSRVHKEWAAVVSNLNQERSNGNLNDVIYGNSVTFGEPNIFEIKSNMHPDIKGIVSMFNVIAKLIPDAKLMEPWSQNQGERLKQLAQKLNRLCELLSWNNLELSWYIHGDGQKIKNEFGTIVFKDHNSPIFKWYFLPGHFQLNPLSKAYTDWRTNFSSTEEGTFPNEWMASLFLKSNETKLLENDDYGNRFPLSLLYNSELRGIDGALSVISLVLYKNTDQKRLPQFLPLVTRWIEKNPVFLSDPNALDKLSLLIYGNAEIQKILDKKGFEKLKKASIDLAEKSPKDVFQDIAAKRPQVNLVIISKHCAECTSLDLSSSRGSKNITDAGLKKLTNLRSLNLQDNKKITDDALRKLTNLESLDLRKQEGITDDSLKQLTNLKNLNLWENEYITNDALRMLTNLESLDLSGNHKITNEALGTLINLKSLNLSNNHNITNEALGNLTNLKSLNLSSNPKITDEALGNLINLKSLNLSSNPKITDIALGKLTNIESLDISNQTKITNDALGNLTNLKSLNLHGRPNRKISIDILEKLNGLTHLGLGNTFSINDSGLETLTNLESLFLTGNNNNTLKPLERLNKLKELLLGYNEKISAEDEKSFRANYPQIKVYKR